MPQEPHELYVPSDSDGHGVRIRVTATEDWVVEADVLIELPALTITAGSCRFSGYHMAAFAEQLGTCHEKMVGRAECSTFDESLSVSVAPLADRAGWFSAALALRRTIHSVEGDATAVTLVVDRITFDQSYVPLVRQSVLSMLRETDVNTNNPWGI